MKHILSVDLGKDGDYTAMALLSLQERLMERVPRHQYDTTRASIVSSFALLGLERAELGTPYTEISRRVARLTTAPAYSQDILVVIDATGVGNAVAEMFAQAGVYAMKLIVTGGHEPSVKNGRYYVPKKDLVAALRTAFDTGRLKVAPGLPAWGDLLAEMTNFVMKRDQRTGHEKFEAWRERDHDDLVLALAMGVWVAYEIEGFGGDRPIAEDVCGEWDPYKTI